MPNNNNTLKAEVAVPLKYLTNFWRSLDLPLINCEIEIDLSCVKRMCNIWSINNTWNPPVSAVRAIPTTGATFQINNAKLYVPVVILLINYDIKFLEQELKRTFLETNIDLK